MKFQVEQQVSWKWLGRKIFGSVQEVYCRPVVKEIKGKFIKRNGSEQKPAYLVKSVAGNLALKLESELESESA
jgi:hypothetical protein